MKCTFGMLMIFFSISSFAQVLEIGDKLKVEVLRDIVIESRDLRTSLVARRELPPGTIITPGLAPIIMVVMEQESDHKRIIPAGSVYKVRYDWDLTHNKALIVLGKSAINNFRIDTLRIGTQMHIKFEDLKEEFERGGHFKLESAFPATEVVY